jgi:hypothetical protein
LDGALNFSYFLASQFARLFGVHLGGKALTGVGSRDA